jgi:uncharacterized protein YndB with AHSA1/START domain
MAIARLVVTIRRRPHEVFAVLSDVTSVPRWSANTLEETLLTPGPLRLGSRRRAVLKGSFGRRCVAASESVPARP